MDNAGAGLIILLLGDPHLLEGGQGREDGASNPYGVLALWRGNDLDLHGRRGKVGDLLLHTVGNTWVHGGTTGQDNVGVQVLTDVDVALHDGVVGGLMDSRLLHTEEGWLEESLRAAESLVADGDDLTVGKLVALLQGGALGRGGHLLLEVEGNIAELLLDVTDDFTLSSGGERVTTLGEDLHEVVGQVTASQVETEDGVGKGISLIDGDGVGHTITGVQDDTGGTAGGVQGEHSLDGNVHGGGVEGLEHDLYKTKNMHRKRTQGCQTRYEHRAVELDEKTAHSNLPLDQTKANINKCSAVAKMYFKRYNHRVLVQQKIQQLI